MRFQPNLASYEAWNPSTKTAVLDSHGRHSDIEILLITFFRIRNAEDLVVNVPDSITDVNVATAIKTLREAACNGTAYKLSLDHSKAWGRDDDDMLAMQDALHLWLDYLLDDMSGQTTERLRRQRVRTWNSGYVQRLAHSFDRFTCESRCLGGAFELLNNDLKEDIDCQFGRRNERFLRYHQIWDNCQSGCKRCRFSYFGEFDRVAWTRPLAARSLVEVRATYLSTLAKESGV